MSVVMSNWIVSTWSVVEKTATSENVIAVFMHKNAFYRRVFVTVTDEVLQDTQNADAVITMLALAACKGIDEA